MKKMICAAIALLFAGSAAAIDLRAFTGSVDQGVASASATEGLSGVASAGNGGGLYGTGSFAESGQSALGGVGTSGVVNTTEGFSEGGSLSGGFTLGSALGTAGSAYGAGSEGVSLGSYDTIGIGISLTP